MLDVLVTTGAVRCAKLQSNRLRQQTNTQCLLHYRCRVALVCMRCAVCWMHSSSAADDVSHAAQQQSLMTAAAFQPAPAAAAAHANEPALDTVLIHVVSAMNDIGTRLSNIAEQHLQRLSNIGNDVVEIIRSRPTPPTTCPPLPPSGAASLDTSTSSVIGSALSYLNL